MLDVLVALLLLAVTLTGACATLVQTLRATHAALLASRATDLAADLLGAVHPYLMPCEGVFTWKRRQRKGEAMTVSEAVLLLRDDGVTRLSSRYGPVADALRYPVPGDRAADSFVARRFQAYFDSFRELE